MPLNEFRFNQGVVTSRDRYDLAPGEVQELIGGYYAPGDPISVHKFGGRSSFGDTASAAKVNGLVLALGDAAGTDRLVALTGSTLYTATAGATGTWAAATPSGLATSIAGTKLDAAQANNRWYITTGSENRALKDDGTLREIGMQGPQEKPVLTALDSTLGMLEEFNQVEENSGFDNQANAVDADDDTYASGALEAAGTAYLTLGSSVSDTSPNRQIQLVWQLGANRGAGVGRPRFGDTGGSSTEGFTVDVKIELSTDSGGNYTTILDERYTTAQAKQTLAIPVDATDLVSIWVKATITYVEGSSITSLRIYRAKISDGANSLTPFDATGGILYAVAERDENENIQGPISETNSITLDSASNHAGVKVDLSTFTQRNSNATHWIIYRTVDGGTRQQLGRVGRVPITTTFFYDTFSDYDSTTQPPDVVPLLAVVADQRATPDYYDRDMPPPPLSRIAYFNGSLVAIDYAGNFRYSVPGLPDSWPAIYVFERSLLPLPENDSLVNVEAVGSSLIVAAEGAMMRVDELPRVVAGLFVASDIVQIKGAPGQVGEYAGTALSINGEQAYAWISPYGVYVTNGHQHRRISDDIDWSSYDGFDKSEWALFWDSNRLCLVLCYSSISGGENDRYWLIHMDQSHQKQGGPKWTGPHYGDIAHLVGGQVASTYRQYSAHTSNGIVYLEDNRTTGADASNSLDASGTHRLRIQSRRVRAGEWNEWAAHDALVNHTAFAGASQTATLAYLVGRYASGHEVTRSLTVSLTGHKGTQVDISRSGDYHEMTLTHDGTGLGNIRSIVVRGESLGESGEVSAA